MRVSNVDRAEVSNALCRHFADGRLDEAEFNDRAARAAAAKTRAGLGGLLSDLPPLYERHPATQPRRGRLGWPSGWAIVAAFVVLTLAWSLVGAVVGLFGPRFPWWIVVVAAFVVLRRGAWRRRRCNTPERWHA
ncbi:MAG: DUF1707 SHOCT-like domain-containing protein [Acidimicrobiales bacterium]